MMPTASRRIPRSMAVIAIACVASASAQPAQTSTQPQYTIQARVPLTIVDVTVTDARGNPVHGLQQSDFTIFEDRQPMQPNSFEEHRSDQAAPAPTVVKPDLPPNTFTNATPTPPSPNPPNILLLDELNTPIQMQQQVTQRMLDFVNKMKPGTQVAVFRLTTSLSILQGFTTDRELLRTALSSKSNFAWDSPVGDDQIPPELPPDARTELEGNHSALQGQYTLSAMQQLARYVSGMPGRKNLIWFSGSFPVAFPPVSDPAVFPGTTMQGETYDLSTEMKAATDVMTRAHLALYPIDWRGVIQVKPLTNPGEMITAERGTMQDLADQTGGKFFYNTNDYAGSVQQSIVNGSNFYTLTYDPTNQTLDTRFRTITVKVDQPGLHLDYRNGYYAVDPTVDTRGKKIETVSPMQSALMRGALDATQILFKVKAVGAPTTEISVPVSNAPNLTLMKPPFRHYAITYTIDINTIEFAAGPDGNYRAAFEYGIRVYNAAGDEIVNSTSRETRPFLPPAAYESMRKNGAVAHDEIDVPAQGEYFLRIAVHDLTSNRVGALEIPTASIEPDAVPAVASAPNP